MPDPRDTSGALVSPEVRRRAMNLIQDSLLRLVHESMATAKDIEKRSELAGIEPADTVEVLRHAAGVMFGMAKKIPVNPTANHEEVLP